MVTKSEFAVISILSFLVMMMIPITVNSACNSEVCGSIVSKCQLLQKCNCVDKNNATCSKECFKCLDYLYMECCLCVEICPEAKDSPLTKTSHVEALSEPQPALFEILTEEPDPLLRWTTHTFPLKASFITTSGDAVKDNINLGSGTKITIKGDGLDQEEDVEVNCTVSFMSDCMSTNKCKSSCASMGASSYRWFLNGCCECVGSTCLNYGLSESKCLECPLPHHREEETEENQSTNIRRDSNTASKTLDSLDYEVAPSLPEEESLGQDNVIKKIDQEELEKAAKSVPAETTSEGPNKKG